MKLQRPEHFISCSFGNDSIALIQWCFEKGIKPFVVYMNTGWASEEWPMRVERGKEWLESLGFPFFEIISQGMPDLVRQRKGFPRHGMQFCTIELKVKPWLEFMERHDPDRDAIVLMGIRREESAGRRDTPEFVEESEKHGMRSLWCPLVAMEERERDDLVYKAGWAPLPHRSKECFPCVNANRNDLKMLGDDLKRIGLIRNLEIETGQNMFRPKGKMGAEGIYEVVRWANSDHGKYEASSPSCESGHCGG